MNIRLYLEASKNKQVIMRQQTIHDELTSSGAAVCLYKEAAAHGNTLAKPKLNKLLEELEPGDVVAIEELKVALKLPFTRVEELVDQLTKKKALLVIVGINNIEDVSKVPETVLKSTQEQLLRVCLYRPFEAQISPRGEKGRKKDTDRNAKIISLKLDSVDVATIMEKTGASRSTIFRVLAEYKESQENNEKEIT